MEKQTTLYRMKVGDCKQWFYTIETGPTLAYEKVRQMLEDNDYYFENKRALRIIEVVATCEMVSLIDTLEGTVVF